MNTGNYGNKNALADPFGDILNAGLTILDQGKQVVQPLINKGTTVVQREIQDRIDGVFGGDGQKTGSPVQTTVPVQRTDAGPVENPPPNGDTGTLFQHEDWQAPFVKYPSPFGGIIGGVLGYLIGRNKTAAAIGAGFGAVATHLVVRHNHPTPAKA